MSSKGLHGGDEAVTTKLQHVNKTNEVVDKNIVKPFKQSGKTKDSYK